MPPDSPIFFDYNANIEGADIPHVQIAPQLLLWKGADNDR